MTRVSTWLVLFSFITQTVAPARVLAQGGAVEMRDLRGGRLIPEHKSEKTGDKVELAKQKAADLAKLVRFDDCGGIVEQSLPYLDGTATLKYGESAKKVFDRFYNDSKMTEAFRDQELDGLADKLVEDSMATIEKRGLKIPDRTKDGKPLNVADEREKIRKALKAAIKSNQVDMIKADLEAQREKVKRGLASKLERAAAEIARLNIPDDKKGELYRQTVAKLWNGMSARDQKVLNAYFYDITLNKSAVEAVLGNFQGGYKGDVKSQKFQQDLANYTQTTEFSDALAKEKSRQLDAVKSGAEMNLRTVTDNATQTEIEGLASGLEELRKGGYVSANTKGDVEVKKPEDLVNAIHGADGSEVNDTLKAAAGQWISPGFASFAAGRGNEGNWVSMLPNGDLYLSKHYRDVTKVFEDEPVIGPKKWSNHLDDVLKNDIGNLRPVLDVRKPSFPDDHNDRMQSDPQYRDTVLSAPLMKLLAEYRAAVGGGTSFEKWWDSVSFFFTEGTKEHNYFTDADKAAALVRMKIHQIMEHTGWSRDAIAQRIIASLNSDLDYLHGKLETDRVPLVENRQDLEKRRSLEHQQIEERGENAKWPEKEAYYTRETRKLDDTIAGKERYWAEKASPIARTLEGVEQAYQSRGAAGALFSLGDSVEAEHLQKIGAKQKNGAWTLEDGLKKDDWVLWPRNEYEWGLVSRATETGGAIFVLSSLPLAMANGGLGAIAQGTFSVRSLLPMLLASSAGSGLTAFLQSRATGGAMSCYFFNKERLGWTAANAIGMSLAMNYVGTVFRNMTIAGEMSAQTAAAFNMGEKLIARGNQIARLGRLGTGLSGGLTAGYFLTNDAIRCFNAYQHWADKQKELGELGDDDRKNEALVRAAVEMDQHWVEFMEACVSSPIQRLAFIRSDIHQIKQMGAAVGGTGAFRFLRAAAGSASFTSRMLPNGKFEVVMDPKTSKLTATVTNKGRLWGTRTTVLGQADLEPLIELRKQQGKYEAEGGDVAKLKGGKVPPKDEVAGKAAEPASKGGVKLPVIAAPHEGAGTAGAGQAPVKADPNFKKNDPFLGKVIDALDEIRATPQGKPKNKWLSSKAEVDPKTGKISKSGAVTKDPETGIDVSADREAYHKMMSELTSEQRAVFGEFMEGLAGTFKKNYQKKGLFESTNKVMRKSIEEEIRNRTNLEGPELKRVVDDFCNCPGVNCA